MRTRVLAIMNLMKINTNNSGLLFQFQMNMIKVIVQYQSWLLFVTLFYYHVRQ